MQRILPFLFMVLAGAAPACAQDVPSPADTSESPAVTSCPPSSADPEEIIRRAADKDILNDQRRRNYTYIQRNVEQKLGSRGEVKSTEIKTYEVMILYGEQVQRLIARNDKPLSARDAAKEEEKIQKLVEKRQYETEEDRRKRLEKYEKDRDHDRAFVREITDAYDFTWLPDETVDRREQFVIQGVPRPGYKPRMKDANILPKFRFKVWIDKEACQWTKLDADVIDTLSFGLFLARLHKGSKLVVETTRVNDEVWLPKHVALKLDAKVALIKNLDYDIDVTYRDYKKFRADTKILPVGEAQQ
jgi:hypothetical protein